jgi:RimJ/RimL family protein N-acetyltransferase
MCTRETARLLLRLPTADDLDPFISIHDDPEVMQHLPKTGTGTRRVAAWRTLALVIGHWHLRGYGQWTVVEKSTNEVIGRVGLWNPEGWPGLEVGWVLRRSRWGHGFATEAALDAMRFAFEVVGADHVISLIRAENLRSIRVAERIGESWERSIVMDGVTSEVYGCRRPTT